MPLLIEVMRMLGVRGSAVGGASLLLVAFYLWRAKRVGSRVATMGAAVVAYSVAILVVLAVVLALGWADPNPGVISEHVHAGVSLALDRASRPIHMAARSIWAWVREMAA